MVATIPYNPYVQIGGNAGLFNTTANGVRQGTAYADPSTRYRLRAGILAQTETIPMWGGVGIYANIPGGGPPAATPRRAPWWSAAPPRPWLPGRRRARKVVAWCRRELFSPSAAVCAAMRFTQQQASHVVAACMLAPGAAAAGELEHACHRLRLLQARCGGAARCQRCCGRSGQRVGLDS